MFNVQRAELIVQRLPTDLSSVLSTILSVVA